MLQLEVFVEEQSTEAGLLIPKILGAEGVAFRIHSFQGKRDMLGKLPSRLKGVARGMSDQTKLVILVDRDQDDCRDLKERLERMCREAGLSTFRSPPDKVPAAMTRIAVEELEAWFFGDPAAVAEAYPGFPGNIARKAGFRDPDAIPGGTWERLASLLREAGHVADYSPKIQVAGAICRHMDVERNTSRSFRHFRDGLRRLCDIAGPGAVEAAGAP